MKRNFIAASMALTMLLALCGCGSTGGDSGTMSPNPSDTTGAVSPSPSESMGTANPSPSESAGTNNGGLPNNAGGTANNEGGAGDAGAGSGTGMSGGAAGTTGDSDHAGSAKSGNYRAGRDGAVRGSGRNLMRDAGDSMLDAARDAGRAIVNG